MCLSIRAIYLEITHSLLAKAFLNNLKRFMSRRRYSKNFISDNETNFTLASKVLQDKVKFDIKHLIKNKLIQSYLLKYLIRWKFITPHAPWQGGIYKRLVGITKGHIKKTCGKNILSLDLFFTFVRN